MEEEIWRGEVSNELKHIAHTMTDVQRQVQDMRCEISTQMEEHRSYHARNEHRWGLARWCRLHPFRLAAMVAAATAAMWANNDPTLLRAIVTALVSLK